jgi:hypothetical protein
VWPASPAVLASQCGDDGCGGSCGECAASLSCENNICEADCQPNCNGKQCGSDGCGDTCGSGCKNNEVCNIDGQCDCVPSCDGKQCGDNGCKGSCGECAASLSCDDFICVCTPQCEGKVCGEDGCGGFCGGGLNCGTIHYNSQGPIWSKKPIDALDPLTPKSAIQAAFYVQDTGQIWVLTGATYHMLQKAGWKWLATGSCDSILPGLSGKTITSAWNVPNSHTGELMDYVKFTTNEAVPKLHIYKLNTEASTFLHLFIEDFDYSGVGVQPHSQQIIATWLVLDGNAYSPGDDAAKWIIPYDLCAKGSKVKTTDSTRSFSPLRGRRMYMRRVGALPLGRWFGAIQ